MGTGDIRTRWGAVSIIVGLLYLGSLTVLVIVVAIDEVDLLATVALALAVLAFAGQVVGSVIQGQSASQQLLESEQVSDEVQDALAELREHTTGLINGSEARVEKLMQGLVSDAIASAVKEARTAWAFDVEEFEASLLAKLRASRVREPWRSGVRPRDPVTEKSSLLQDDEGAPDWYDGYR